MRKIVHTSRYKNADSFRDHQQGSYGVTSPSLGKRPCKQASVPRATHRRAAAPGEEASTGRIVLVPALYVRYLATSGS